MTDKEPIRCLSMGAGVQTTAILLKFWKRYQNGYIIFADTGDEKKEETKKRKEKTYSSNKKKRLGIG